MRFPYININLINLQCTNTYKNTFTELACLLQLIKILSRHFSYWNLLFFHQMILRRLTNTWDAWWWIISASAFHRSSRKSGTWRRRRTRRTTPPQGHRWGPAPGPGLASQTACPRRTPAARPPSPPASRGGAFWLVSQLSLLLLLA